MATGRVLVVDDEPPLVDVLTAVLEDAGYQVRGTAGAGAGALRLARA